MPRDVVHTFKNVGDQPSRMLISTTPSGFETFFARCAEEFAKPGGPDMTRIIEIGAKHGIHFMQDLITSLSCSERDQGFDGAVTSFVEYLYELAK